MKQTYQAMRVDLVGSVGTIVNKTGTYVDCSRNFITKTKDNGGGQEKNCNPRR